jgi:plastocyanin
MSRGIVIIIVIVIAIWSLGISLQAQQTTPLTTMAMTATVRGRVQIIGAERSGKKHREAIPKTVVWLTPITTAEVEVAQNSPPGSSPSAGNLRLVQKNKSFEPHILVVPAGADVEFPNRDPFFHNVFSLFEGKRFDLGLYEAGSSRMVRFDRPGISYIFCNIHPQMSAVVLTLTTPLYAVSNADGQLTLAGVPYGRYTLHIWSEGMGPENSQPLTREITVSENASSLGSIRVPEANGERIAHKNKYGRDYDDPTPNNSIYNQPQ